jgi:hypothetical protein
MDLALQVHFTGFPPEASNAWCPAKLLADYLDDRSNNLLTGQGEVIAVLWRDGGWGNGMVDFSCKLLPGREWWFNGQWL